MLTMEAELRALREELVSRPSKTSKNRHADAETPNGDNKADATADDLSSSKRARLSQTSDEVVVVNDVSSDAGKETSATAESVEK